jgi:hypothetical protein
VTKSERRRAQRVQKAALIEAKTWVPKPPVGHQAVVYCVRDEGIRLAMLAALNRGQRRQKKIHNVAVSG